MPFSHIHTPLYVATRNSGKSGKEGPAGHFYDTLLELDETVGHIMAALAADKAVDENTLTFLTGDNGPWECKCNLSGSAGPYRGMWQRNQGGGGSASKTTIWEGGHREVGVARWPGKIKPRVSNATVSHPLSPCLVCKQNWPALMLLTAAVRVCVCVCVCVCVA